jgi:tetratricopeptide (TPR) repeat protein
MSRCLPAAAASLVLLGVLGLAGCTATPPRQEPVVGPAMATATDFGADGFETRMLAAAAATTSDGGTPETWRVAEDVLVAGLSAPQFASLPAETRGALYSAAAWGAVRRNDAAAAKERFAHAVRLRAGDARDRWMLAQAALLSGDANLSAGLLSEFPDLARMPASRTPTIMQVLQESDPDGADRFRMLQALYDADWVPTRSGKSYYLYELAAVHLRRGSREAAKGPLLRLTDPGYLVRVRADRRFDGLYDPADPRFDVARAAQADVDALRETVGDPPRASRDAANLMRALTLVGAADEAIVLSDRLLADAGIPEGLVPLDVVESIVARRGYALAQAGRDEEAMEVLEAAAKLQTAVRGNVDQALDLAAEYCARGRGDDALAMARRVEPSDTSAFGRYMQQYAMHCAHVLRRDDIAAAAALAHLAEHRAEHPGVYYWALLRAGRPDEAAASIARDLADERMRGNVLFALQDFRLAPVHAAERQMSADWKALLARRDVRAAVDAVGRIETYAIYMP